MVQGEQASMRATSRMLIGRPKESIDPLADEVSSCGYCCGFLCPRLGADISNDSVAFTSCGMAYFSLSRAVPVLPERLPVIVTFLPFKRSVNELAKPVGQHEPAGPEENKEQCKFDDAGLSRWGLEEFDDEDNRKTKKHKPEADTNQKLEELPREGDSWLWRREFPRSALGAAGGKPWVNVKTRTEFYIVATSASLAE